MYGDRGQKPNQGATDHGPEAQVVRLRADAPEGGEGRTDDSPIMP